jgi:Tat protein translocase TatB subunit
MNIFSNIGITELLFILLLALLVVGPERLPEMGKKLGQILRDVRKAYDNLTRDLGPELTSLQQTTRELRESMDSVRSIPKDMVQTVVKAADLDETIGELKGVSESLGQVGKTLSDAQRAIKNPVAAAVSTAQEALRPPKLADLAKQAEPESGTQGQVTTEAQLEPEPQGQVTTEAQLEPEPQGQVTIETQPEPEPQGQVITEARPEPEPEAQVIIETETVQPHGDETGPQAQASESVSGEQVDE